MADAPASCSSASTRPSSDSPCRRLRPPSTLSHFSQLQWFVSAYTVVFAAVTAPAGLLADRYGRKRLLLIALVVLGVGSVACAYADTSGQFMAARIPLGVGAAMVIPAALGALWLFSDEERPKAVAAVMAATRIGQPIAPLGGRPLTTFWWGSVFLINIPVVFVAAAAAVFVPESRSERRPHFDVPGIVASSAGLGWSPTASSAPDRRRGPIRRPGV